MARRKAAPGPVEAAPPIELDALGRVHLFPVRHHSPRAAAALAAFLDEVRPQAVLVEGPADAGELIEVLVDPETVPPVALLAYRTDGTADSALWPFAAYSPEYVALAWAARRGARAELIDLTAGQALAAQGSPLKQLTPGGAATTDGADEGDGGDGGGDELGSDDAEDATLHDRCAQALGHRSFEELWEARFEAPAYDPAQFREALLGYADLLCSGPQRAYDRARDVIMARHISRVVASGVAPERVAVVVGAAHAALLARGELDPALAAALPPPAPCALTIIPFSFPRLAEQLGYGAGNRAPQYYQRAHEAGCDYRRATLETLVEFTEHLRLRGFSASLADTIEAYRLSLTLADLRGKAAPGLDELREASIATLCRGEAAHVDGFLWPSVIGRRVGSVARRIGRNSLQEEFWQTVRALRLPQADEPQRFHLHLHDAHQLRASTFLHRLRVAEVPYASYLGSGALRPGDAGDRDEPGGVAALGRVRESWEGQWTPATETALVERIVLGDTLEGVAAHALGARLGDARGTGAAAEVLAEAALCACPQLVAQALSRCEELAASDDDLPSLARAVRALSGLLSSGGRAGAPKATTEAQAGPKATPTPTPQAGPAAPAGSSDLLARLCRATFARAVLRAEGACAQSDEAMEAVLPALRTLHDVALGQAAVDRQAWVEAGRKIAESYAVHPRAAGFCCGLLFQAQLLSDDEVVREVGQRLSDVQEPLRASGFLEGFFAVNAVLLSRNRLVVQALDSFLCGIPRERFTDALPLLRRAFSPLGATERRYLLENLIALRGLHEQRLEARAVLEERDKEALKAMNEDLGRVLDDLDDLL